jgi:murein DD-endopeptidase MepM/ murein hydrolase activator NlpD
MEELAPALVVHATELAPAEQKQFSTIGQPAIKLPSAPKPAPPPECTPSESAAYCIYTVEEGDTLSHVAVRFGLNGGPLAGWELLAASNKPDITNVDDFIQPGQKLRVPTKRGLVHTVLLDETIGDLADVFDVTSASIIAANNLSNADLLPIGFVLIIPDPQRLEAPPPEVAAPEPEPAPSESSEPAPEPQPEEPAPQEEPAPEPPRSSNGFIWPITASAKITNYMSARHPLGIDLGLAHAPRSSIVAVADGEVTFAGGNACCSYGLYVIVDHGNGLRTLYAHLSRLDVRKGQSVSQGQTLGPAGSTGYSTGVHLHFEVHKNGTRVNPMTYLP